MKTLILTAFSSRKGVSAAEYAVLAVGIIVVVAAAAKTFGIEITSALNTVTFT